MLSIFLDESLNFKSPNALSHGFYHSYNIYTPYDIKALATPPSVDDIVSIDIVLSNKSHVLLNCSKIEFSGFRLFILNSTNENDSYSKILPKN